MTTLLAILLSISIIFNFKYSIKLNDEESKSNLYKADSDCWEEYCMKYKEMSNQLEIENDVLKFDNEELNKTVQVLTDVNNTLKDKIEKVIQPSKHYEDTLKTKLNHRVNPYLKEASKLFCDKVAKYPFSEENINKVKSKSDQLDKVLSEVNKDIAERKKELNALDIINPEDFTIKYSKENLNKNTKKI